MADSTTFVSRMEKDDNAAEVHRRQRRDALSRWSDIWSESTRLQKFANGDQWPEGDKKALDKAARKVARLTYDKISVILQTFSGKEILGRFERGYVARHPSAARQGEIMTAIDRAYMMACDAEQVISQGFKDGPGIQGISAQRWELDTLNERGGGILIDDIPIWQVMADPEARKVNLSDRSWHCYGKWYPQSEVRRRWPEKYEKLKSGYGGGKAYSEGGETGVSSRIPWAGMIANQPIQPYYAKGQTWWVEFKEWRQVETYYDVGVPADETMSYADAMVPPQPDPTTGQMPPPSDPYTTRTLKTKAELKEFQEQHRATFAEEVPGEMIAERPTLVYRYAYLCGDVELETGECPTGYWTIQFLTGFRFPLADKVMWRSLVSRLVDPQKWVNVFASALVRNFMVNPKGVLFVEEGLFKNHDDAMAAWASPGGLIRVKPGGLSAGTKKFEWVQGGQSQLSQMVGELLTLWRDSIPELAGFNPATLGQLGNDLRRISGEVVRQVQDAAMTSNAEPFDALRLHRREGGRIFLSFLRRFFEVEDIIRIVGEDVAYETVTQPAVDPMTGQPARDPLTGEVLMQPVPDPATGEPMRRLVIPPKEAWSPDWWKEIAVEDVVPSGDQLQVLWKSLETSIQILLQPQPDTGAPLFSSEDLAEIIPGIPAQRREKMLQRIKARILMQQQQQWQQAASQGAGQQVNGQAAA